MNFEKWRTPAKIIGLAAFVGSLILVGCQISQDRKTVLSDQSNENSSNELAAQKAIKVVQGWDNVVFDGVGPLPGTLREQVADIVYGGHRRIAIAYIKGTNGDPSNKGPLGIVNVDIENHVKQILPETGMISGWVRGATGGPIDTGGCPLVISPLAANATNPNTILDNPEFIDYFSADHFESANNQAVYILRVRWCNGRLTYTKSRIASGKIPSVSIGKRGNETRLLVVYGRDFSLMGYFLDTDGKPVGSEFIITAIDGTLKSTDVIWNPVSGQFIIGYMRYRPGSIDSMHPNLCSVHNVRVGWSGGTEAPVLRGVCDGFRTGHHTYVDYDYNHMSNPSGRYYWWYQDLEGTKGFHLMGASGNPVSGTGVVGGFVALTAPVSYRRATTVENPLAHPSSALLADQGEYVSVIRGPSVGNQDASIQVRFLSDVGNIDTLGSLPGELPPSGAVIPVAVESLLGESVMLWRQDPGPIVDNNNTLNRWGITVFSHMKPPGVFAPR